MTIFVFITFLYFLVLQEGSTCVHIAAMRGSVSVMKELLKFNPSGITTARNKVKWSWYFEQIDAKLKG